MSDPDWNELRKQVSHGMSVPSGLAGRMMDRIEELEARSDGLTAAVREIHDLEAEVERLRAALEAIIEYYEEGGNQPITYKRIAHQSLAAVEGDDYEFIEGVGWSLKRGEGDGR